MLKNRWPWMEVRPGVCKNFKKNCQKPVTPATLVVTYRPQFYMCYDSRDTVKFSSNRKEKQRKPPSLGYLVDKALILRSLSTSRQPPLTSGIPAVPHPGISWTSYLSFWFLTRGNPGSQLLGREVLLELLKCFFLPPWRWPGIRGPMDKGCLDPIKH